MTTIDYKGYTATTYYSYCDMSIRTFIKELNTNFTVTEMTLSGMNIPTKKYLENCINLFLSQKKHLIQTSFTERFNQTRSDE